MFQEVPKANQARALRQVLRFAGLDAHGAPPAFAAEAKASASRTKVFKKVFRVGFRG